MDEPRYALFSPFYCEECTSGTWWGVLESSLLNVGVLLFNTVAIIHSNAGGADEEVKWNDKFK